MSARNRAERERPWAVAVKRSGEHLASTPTLPDAARTAGLFAIAHALLDVSDSIRYHADTTRKADR